MVIREKYGMRHITKEGKNYIVKRQINKFTQVYGKYKSFEAAKKKRDELYKTEWIDLPNPLETCILETNNGRFKFNPGSSKGNISRTYDTYEEAVKAKHDYFDKGIIPYDELKDESNIKRSTGAGTYTVFRHDDDLERDLSYGHFWNLDEAKSSRDKWIEADWSLRAYLEL